MLVIANSYVEEQTDEFESKRPGTDRLCFLALIFPEITPFTSSIVTVMDLVTWPMNTSEAGGDLALIQASLLFSFKCHQLA